MPDLTDVEVEEIFFNRRMGSCGDIGVITLNRPKALNALSQTMCEAILAVLSDWESDRSIKAVVVRGAGDKAFCAGGDIRQIYDNGPSEAKTSIEFFRHEYQMNAAIKHFSKPYITLMDGITMGGGCGLSMHGQYRIATERLMLAMPETGIGFFPDVGGGHFLSRCPDYSGFYLGLTGNRINAADALYTGFATHTISSDDQDDLLYKLSQAQWGENLHLVVDGVVSHFHKSMGESALSQNKALLAKYFNQSSVADVIKAIETCEVAEHQAWCDKTLKTLLSKSPTSVRVSFEQLSRATDMTFDDALKMEFNITWNLLHQHDFYEGVRAAVVDKDRNPQWQPAQLADVDQSSIDQCFEAAPEPLEL